MVAIDINRGTSGVSLPTEVSAEIWTNVQEQSAVQQVARRVPLPGNGLSIDIIATEPVASWVAESEEKPVSRGTVSSKAMRAHMLTVIVPFSNQFKRDKNALYNAMVQQLPAALAKKFDQTVFGYVASPGSGFDTLATAPTASINTAGAVYTQLLGVMGTIAANGGDLTHIVSSTQAKIKLLSELDGNDRPLFVGDPTSGQLNSVLAPLVPSRHVYDADAAGTGGVNGETLAIAGDWADSAMWGQVGPIDVAISDQATLNDGGTIINLWQRNMFAVRVEVELGFAVKAVNRFVRLLGADVA
jgi:HK97 family phage major capsid protein